MPTDFLSAQLAEMAQLLPQYQKANPAISKESIGWHIYHNLKVINGVYQATKASKPENYKWRFNFARLMVFLMGRIPRGKGKAPKQVVPPADIQLADIEQQLAQARQGAADFPKLDPKAYFDHPFFGMLTLKKTLRFLEIHTDHHIKIMRDILR
jgi:hypothetical protein